MLMEAGGPEYFTPLTQFFLSQFRLLGVLLRVELDIVSLVMLGLVMLGAVE